MTYLDTHLVVWLYAGALELIPESVSQILERDELRISPMCELELQYLYETKRIKEEASKITSELSSKLGLTVCTLPFERIISIALAETWTRDPFDRIICAHARLQNATLLTKDGTIRKNYSGAVWGK